MKYKKLNASLVILVPMLLLSFQTVADAGNGGPDSVQKYCERFAAAVPSKLLKSKEAVYIDGSATTSRPSFTSALLFASNFFQPPDSRFANMWKCEFHIQHQGLLCAGEVDLPVAEFREFAEYTSWEKLVIVEGNNTITANDGSVIGYAVAKYYKLRCPDGK